MLKWYGLTGPTYIRCRTITRRTTRNWENGGGSSRLVAPRKRSAVPNVFVSNSGLQAKSCKHYGTQRFPLPRMSSAFNENRSRHLVGVSRSSLPERGSKRSGFFMWI